MQFGLIVLTILYFYQGLLIGLPAGGIQILFAHEPNIGIFTYCLIPFFFKFAWSPILDYYFIGSIGKRKTYIIPTHFLMGGLLIYLSTLELTLLNIFYIYFIVSILLSTSDTAIDGWQVTLLDNVAQGSVCQTFGQQIGWFFSQYIFNLLHYHYHFPLWTYLLILGIIGILMAIFVIFVHETNPEVVCEYQSLIDEIKQVKGLYYNKYLRQLSIILLLQRIGMGFMDFAAPIVLVREGLHKNTLGQIAIISFLFSFWIPLYMGKFVSGKKKENRILILALTYQTINMALFGFSLYEFQTFETKTIYLFGFYLCLHEALKKVFTVSMFSFIAEIAEPQLAGMQISIMASIHSSSRLFIDPLILQCSNFINIYILILGCLVYQIVQAYYFNDKYQNMQFIPKENWTLHNDNYVELIQQIK